MLLSYDKNYLVTTNSGESIFEVCKSPEVQRYLTNRLGVDESQIKQFL